jgi:hypothetical protein
MDSMGWLAAFTQGQALCRKPGRAVTDVIACCLFNHAGIMGQNTMTGSRIPFVSDC